MRVPPWPFAIFVRTPKPAPRMVFVCVLLPPPLRASRPSPPVRYGVAPDVPKSCWKLMVPATLENVDPLLLKIEKPVSSETSSCPPDVIWPMRMPGTKPPKNRFVELGASNSVTDSPFPSVGLRIWTPRFVPTNVVATAGAANVSDAPAIRQAMRIVSSWREGANPIGAQHACEAGAAQRLQRTGADPSGEVDRPRPLARSELAGAPCSGLRDSSRPRLSSSWPRNLPKTEPTAAPVAPRHPFPRMDAR